MPVPACRLDGYRRGGAGVRAYMRSEKVRRARKNARRDERMKKGEEEEW